MRRSWAVAVRQVLGGGSRKSVLQVAGGAFSAQLLALLALPVLSRLYTPEAFGTLAVILATSTLFAVVVSLQLELAIPNATDSSDAQFVARIALGTSLLLSGALALLIWFPKVTSLTVALSPDYIGWTLLATALTAIFTILSQLYIWLGEFSRLGMRSFWQGIVATSTSVLFGFAGLVSTGLLLSQALGRVAAIVMMARSLGRHRATTPMRGPFQWRSLLKYPLLFMPAGILNALGRYLPLLLVAAWFGADDAGLFGLAQRLLMLPSAIVGLAISQVFLGRLAEIRRSALPNQRRATQSALKFLVPAGLVIIIGGELLAPLATWVLGDQWVGISGFIQATCIVQGMSFMAAPLQQILVANARAGLNFLLDASRVVLVLGAAVAARRAGLDAFGSVLAMALAQALNYSLTIVVGWWSAKTWDHQHVPAVDSPPA